MTSNAPAALGGDSGLSFEARLIQKLSGMHLLTTESADRALRAQARANGSLVDVLVRLGLCAERDLAPVVAEVTGCEFIKASEFPETPVAVPVSNPQFLRDAKVLPVSESQRGIVVAAADPTRAFTARALELAFGRPVLFAVAAGSDIEDAVLRLYGDGPERNPDTSGVTALDVANADFARLKEAASEAPIVRFVERLIARAVEQNASDIHIEPLERTLRVRMRVDGVLRDEEPAPLSSAPAIVSRIKILSRLDIAERRLPQDGSIKMNVRGRQIDMRVATGPVAQGESVVVRILDRAAVELDLAKLGFEQRTLAQLTAIFSRPSGMVLVTGPTGSGKSTTLYAGLSRLNTAERKIVTIEDPVEYKIDGLNQFQVKPEIDFDFARALRSLLRHDPDIVMVGEIRDGETARIAMQAALTGHLVLSTLHTNDAATAVTRLMDMGVEDYLIASTLTGVLAQRLVRVLCTKCREQCDIPLAIKSGGTDGAGLQAFRAVGCVHCGETGYRGRTVISEFLSINDELRQAVLRHEEAVRLRTIAMRAGMQPLYDNGIARVIEGVTTYDEVVRVAQDVS